MNSDYKAAECPTIFHLAESAFPILSVPGFWETFKERRADQVVRRVRTILDPEELHCLSRQGPYSYTIVPWED